MGCDSCTFRDVKGRTSACGGCKYYEDKRFRFELGKVDLGKMHVLAVENVKRKISEAVPQLSECPSCLERSLYYDCVGDKFECLNLGCVTRGKLVLHDTQEYSDLIKDMQRRRVIKPVSMRRLEYDIYVNYLRRGCVVSEVCFEVDIED